MDALDQAGNWRGARALAVTCQEEAAKILILLDIARSGTDQKAISKCCEAFYSHTSRGIYAYVHEANPADFAEVMKYVEDSRPSHHLDGPTGADWVFLNDLQHRRESSLYVDYMEYEPGNLQWSAPEEGVGYVSTRLSKLTISMKESGMLSAAGVHAVAQVWKGATYDRTTRWEFCRKKNLEVLSSLIGGAVPTDKQMHGHWRHITEKWTFPLTTLDVRLKEVPFGELETERADFYARYGYGLD